MFAKQQKGLIDLVEKTKQKFDPIDFSIKTKFKHIFYSYILVIIIFAVIYYILNTIEGNGLMSIYTKEQIETNFEGFMNTLYFSFVTATTSAYGDIAPIGLSKSISMIEIITGLMMFGMLVSKIVSYKQDIVLDELYNLTFEDKINRLRSAMYLFRSDSNRMIDKIEATPLTSKKLQDSATLVTSFETALEDVEKLLCPQKKKEFIKNIDELTLELIINSLSLSLIKMTELITALNSIGDKQWKTERMVDSISKIKTYCNKIHDYYQDQKLSTTTITKIRDISKNLYEMENAIEKGKNQPNSSLSSFMNKSLA